MRPQASPEGTGVPKGHLKGRLDPYRVGRSEKRRLVGEVVNLIPSLHLLPSTQFLI